MEHSTTAAVLNKAKEASDYKTEGKRELTRLIALAVDFFLPGETWYVPPPIPRRRKPWGKDRPVPACVITIGSSDLSARGSPTNARDAWSVCSQERVMCLV